MVEIRGTRCRCRIRTVTMLSGSRRPVDPPQRQELLGLDVEPVVVLDQRLHEVVDGHQRQRDARAFGLVSASFENPPVET